jgi:hypothetical protein
MMDTRKFVDLLRIVVRDAAVSGELSVLRNPPGRRPSDDLQERSKWYHSLSDDQKTILSSIILDVADRAVFGFLCVLDGVRAIEDDGDKGHLELRYVRDNSTLLNPPEGEMLRELW